MKVKAWFNLIQQLRNGAASRIQNMWKKYKRIKIEPYLRHNKETISSIIIQKYLRGYMVSKHYQHQIRQIKMDSCFAYFEAMKHDLHTDS